MNPFAPLTELSRMLASGELSSARLTQGYLDRIDRLDPILHAYASVRHDRAMQEAVEADKRRAAGQARGPLDGLPIAIKDLCEIAGEITTCGSQAWSQRRSVFTSAVVERLRAQGMVCLGKAHMVEFAFGTFGSNALMGTPRNPWDAQVHRIPGGSSSGSGVAVAAGLAPAAIGSDTGGSIRIPASLLGITGLKPTASRISLQGVLPLSPTLDSVGPMTRSVDDAALLFSTLIDNVADGSTATAGSYAAAAAGVASQLSGMRIGIVPDEQLPPGTEPDVVDALRRFGRFLQDTGAVHVRRRFPFDFEDLGRRSRAIIAAEAWRIHAPHIEDETLPIGPHVRSRVRSGKSISEAMLNSELRDRRRLIEQWSEAMTDFDLLLAPSLPCAAIALEDVDETSPLLGAFTRAVNYLDGCAISLPAGFTAEGLPIGMQLIASPHNEALLFRVGRAWQRVSDWHARTPPALVSWHDPV